MKRLLVPLLLVVACAWPMSEVYACSCAPPGTPLEERDMSDFVFAGEVLRIDTVIVETYPWRSVRFRVQRLWKGPDSTQVDVLTGMNDADCGFPFEVGEKYLVYAWTYAYEDGEAFNTNICSRTNVLSRAAENLTALGEGMPVSVEEEAAPCAFSLAQNYPNPFNPTTHIAYTLERPGFVALQVYDLRGRRLRTLALGFRPAGAHAVTFDAGTLPSGVYLYALTVDGAVARKTMALVR